MMKKKTDLEPSAVLEQLSHGQEIHSEERTNLVESLRVALQSEDPDTWDFDEIYEIVLVIGRIKAQEATPLLERLFDAQEPMTLCLVLEILCEDWKKSEYYLERVMNFAVGAVWDEEHDVQEKALEILGKYVSAWQGQLKVGPILELFSQLLYGAEEPGPVRLAAWRAVAGVVAGDSPELQKIRLSQLEAVLESEKEPKSQLEQSIKSALQRFLDLIKQSR